MLFELANMMTHDSVDAACSTAWDDKLGGATGYGAALLAQWAILEGQS
jgi:hypothetical protein